MFGKPVLLAILALLPEAALACGHGGCTSTGGTPAPAPASVALFALGVTLLLTRSRRA